ncbi:hypothetical protein AB0M79_35245 [Polymorphospora sp. NPDC051019]
MNAFDNTFDGRLSADRRSPNKTQLHRRHPDNHKVGTGGDLVV